LLSLRYRYATLTRMAGKPTKDELLQQAVEATQNGEPARSREALLKLLEEDNREPLYWLLMSTAVESRDERIYCLQNVLFLDPENSAARHDLELLGADVPDLSTPALIAEETENWQTKEIAAPKIAKLRKKTREQPWSLTWILSAIGTGVVIIILGFYAAQNGMLDIVLPSSPTPTLRSGASTAVVTSQSEGPVATRTVGVISNNPEDLLEATYTPTPIYINTPHPGENAVQDGLAAFQAGECEAATALFRNAITLNPTSPDLYYYLGESLLCNGDTTGAFDTFNSAISLDPQFAPGYLGRAKVGMALGSEATIIITDLNTAILLDPSYVDAYLTRAVFNMQREAFDSAEGDVASAETIAPNSALVQYYKGLVQLEQNEFALALQASERAEEMDVTLLPNYLLKAEAQQGLGLYQDSVETMQLFLPFDGDSGPGWELLGVGFWHTDRQTEALDSFNQALSIDPMLPKASYYLGLVDLEAGLFQSALAYMQIAVQGEPDWFEARIGRARALLGTGNPSGAFFEINATSDLIDSDEQRAQYFYWRATTLEALGQPDNALADWRSLLALPESAVPTEWRQLAQDRVGQ
jgi:tetratricopeptide (TPR) repeat protein